MTGYLVDGQSLDREDRWILDSDTLLPAIPARNVSRLEVPGRSGVVAKRLGWGTGSLKVSVTVLSWDDVPVVQALLGRAESVTKTGETPISARVVEVSVSDPARVARDVWQVQADFELQPFWREESTLTYTALDVGAVVFPQWARSTGDVVDGVLRLKGPFTKATIAHGGREARFDTARTASQYLFFEPSSFTAWTGEDTAWARPASMSNRVLVEYGAAGPLTALTPSTSGVEIAVSGEGMVTLGVPADRTQISLRGGRYWL